jgi:hypothetical protein
MAIHIGRRKFILRCLRALFLRGMKSAHLALEWDAPTVSVRLAAKLPSAGITLS